MDHKFIKFDDKMGITKDLICKGQNKTFRTSIDAFDQFGNVLFSKAQNNVVLGGSIYVLEKLLNVRANLQVADLNSIVSIMNGSTYNNVVANTQTWPKEHYICLWGIGIDGSGENIGSVRNVNFYEREIGSNGNLLSGMIPFRVVNTDLSDTDKTKYFFHNPMSEEGYTGYYLKTFSNPPVIRACFDDSIDDEVDGTEVTSSIHNTNRTDNIEVFAEIMLFLSKKDVREYFNTILKDVSLARINSIALCSGIAKEYEQGKVDYAHVKMITKLNFGNEMLENKEITFRYRIYTN